MRIAIIGDSQSEGLAPVLPPLLRRNGFDVGRQMLVRGMSLRSMRSSTELTARARETASGAEGIVVILGGNNTNPSRADYLELLRWFYGEVIAGRRVWWVGPAASADPTWGARHAATVRLQRELVGRFPNTEWIDAWGMTARGVQHAPDGLHFTREGYRTWAHRLAGEIVLVRTSTYVGAMALGAALGVWLAIRGGPR